MKLYDRELGKKVADKEKNTADATDEVLEAALKHLDELYAQMKQEQEDDGLIAQEPTVGTDWLRRMRKSGASDEEISAVVERAKRVYQGE